MRVKRTLLKLLSKQREPVQHAVRNLWAEMRISIVTRRSVSELKGLRQKKGLKIQLGCGQDVRSGWVNIDLDLHHSLTRKATALPDAVFINHDLRTGLPLDNNSCDYIYSSHFLEHLEYKQGFNLLRECHRALTDGGVFRIALPDYRGIFRAYLQGDHSYFKLIDDENVLEQVGAKTRTLCDFVNFCVYQYGEHKCIYDEDHLTALLKEVGYSAVEVSSFQEGIDPATSIRQHHSFYVEARK
jgi:predicted SAM-dependent methyltransferase